VSAREKCQLELLINDRLETGAAGESDDGAHFGAEDVLGLRLAQEIVEIGDGLQHLNAICFGSQPLVDLE
jgi:hypothetical protein